VFDLIAAGSLDRAEMTAADLLLRFPELPEGHECLAMVDEARGNHPQAADHYRQALDIVRAHPDDFDPEFEVTLQTLIDRLNPASKT
jgi:Tfp pilus assembly protein PilF